LPQITEGNSFVEPKTSIAEHFTAPPKAFSEATLLSAMENAADTAPDAERKGLGTPATRAAIIEKIIISGFAERKGKQLIPTQDGMNLIAILPEALTSPQLTAEWENALTLIAQGKADPADFMRKIEDMAKDLCKDFANAYDSKNALFKPKKEVIGACPRCGKSVYESAKNFHCEDRNCGFVMWKNDRFFESRKKVLTKQIASALLKNGKAKISALRSEKTGKTFDAVVVLADTGGKYVNFRFEPKAKADGGVKTKKKTE
jgi:DNA topoisomerase-3